MSDALPLNWIPCFHEIYFISTANHRKIKGYMYLSSVFLAPLLVQVFVPNNRLEGSVYWLLKMLT
jgi:hypothetical protein